MTERSKFAGGDQDYLKDDQYRDGSNLGVRMALHARFSTAERSFPDFAASFVDWPTAGRALDCGCGTGGFWQAASIPRETSLELTDLSDGMVAAAVSSARDTGFGEVSGQACDVQDLPFDDGSFDVVVANHMLYHVPDPDLAISELARVLRPEGTLVASTNHYGHMGAINDAIADVFGSHGEALYEVFGLASGEARLRKAFRDISWHAYDNTLVVTEPEAAVAYGLSFPPGDGATPDEQAAFAEAIHRRVVDGVLTINTRVGVFICQRPRN